MSFNSSHLYGEEKLFQALECLTAGLGPLRKRLAEAALYLTRLESKHFADSESWKVAQGLRDDLIFADPRPDDEGSMGATTKRLSDYDAQQIANRILDLYLQTKNRNRDG